jgi:hypothetical protein
MAGCRMPHTHRRSTQEGSKERIASKPRTDHPNGASRLSAGVSDSRGQNGQYFVRGGERGGGGGVKI